MNVVIVIAPKDFRDEELLEPQRCLEEAGHKVLLASTVLGTCVGIGGTRAEATLRLEEVEPSAFDGAVFVGGPGARALFALPAAHRIARELFRQGKVVAAICIAPVILARAGVLEGRKATVFETEQDSLTDAGAVVRALGVVTDGSLVTARGPREARDFGKAVVDALAVHRSVPKAASVAAHRASR